MMTGEQKSRVAALKAQIAATAGAGTPLKIRAVAVALKQELRRDGITARALAASIGIHESTLCHWERVTVTNRGPVAGKAPRSRGAGFRIVHVAEPAATTTVSPSSVLSVPTTSARGL